MGNQGQVIGDRNGGYQEVIGADRGALEFKFGANTACEITSNVVEGEADEGLEKLLACFDSGLGQSLKILRWYL